ncbi:hypothetical protein [Microbaculum sp. FT89]|uniref:hypothetical protein n=1 Tax=Microbaculum sp. FT89 TaxID=3447298 RepID=UPI003F529C7F
MAKRDIELSGRKGRDGEGKLPAIAPPSDQAAAEYLAGILPELVHIADQGGLDLTAYLLEMARIEATSKAMNAASRKPR